MKKIFKLAAIAVSMALVASLVACSSGDDDVVDATTPEYLVATQIGKYVASIKYDQNVSDKEIEELEKAHEAVMDMLGDCAGCLEAYFVKLKVIDTDWDSKGEYSWRGEADSSDIVSGIKDLAYLKSYGTEKDYHKVYVYKPAIEKALRKLIWFEDLGTDYESSWWGVARGNVASIGNATYADDGKVVNANSILNGKLNDRQAEDMKAYIDAAAALKAALTEDDKTKTCKDSIEAADKAIKAFEDLKNEGVKKEGEKSIDSVIDAVDKMCKDIQKNVYAKIQVKVR